MYNMPDISGMSDTERKNYAAEAQKKQHKRLRSISPVKIERDYAKSLAETDCRRYKCLRCAYYHYSLNSRSSCKMPYQQEYVEFTGINPCHEGILLKLCDESPEIQHIFDKRWLDVFGDPEEDMPKLMYSCLDAIRTLSKEITEAVQNGGTISESSYEYASSMYKTVTETLDSLDKIIEEDSREC